MGSKPKKSEYQATDEEKASAAVAKANYDFFKANYAPLLREMRDQSRSEDNRRALRGRASADTMQALTSQPTFQQTQNVSRAGDLSQALGGQLGVANASAKQIQHQMATNDLGTARGQAADAQSGMAQASRSDQHVLQRLLKLQGLLPISMAVTKPENSLMRSVKQGAFDGRASVHGGGF